VRAMMCSYCACATRFVCGCLLLARVFVLACVQVPRTPNKHTNTHKHTHTHTHEHTNNKHTIHTRRQTHTHTCRHTHTHTDNTHTNRHRHTRKTPTKHTQAYSHIRLAEVCVHLTLEKPLCCPSVSGTTVVFERSRISSMSSSARVRSEESVCVCCFSLLERMSS